MRIFQLSMVASGSQQEDDQVDMEINNSEPTFQLSPVRIPIPHIADFVWIHNHQGYGVELKMLVK
jgi:hypothetical protein